MQHRDLTFRIAIALLFSGFQSKSPSKASGEVLGGAPPKFSLGQQVYKDFVSADRDDPDRYNQRFRDLGVVVGVIKNPDNWFIRSWIYVVRWHESPSSPWMKLPYTEECPEGRLRRVKSR